MNKISFNRRTMQASARSLVARGAANLAMDIVDAVGERQPLTSLAAKACAAMAAISIFS